MNPGFYRSFVGYLMIAVGITILAAAIWDRKLLWHGIRTVEITKTIEVPAKEQNGIPLQTKVEQLGDGQFETGNLEIRETYVLKDSNLPSGEIQVRDANNSIWMLHICPAEENGVLPSFKEHSVVNIIYSKGHDCTRFLSAHLIKDVEK